MYFICSLLGCGVGAHNLIKFVITTAQGWLCYLQYPAQLFLTWSGEVNLPNNGVSLCLQNRIDLNYNIRFAVLWLASVLSRCLEEYWGADVLIWGLRMGPQSLQKFCSTLYYC